MKNVSPVNNLLDIANHSIKVDMNNNLFGEIEIFYQAANIQDLEKLAKKLNKTIETINKKLKNLEKKLGITLFKQTAQTIYLTKEGQEFYEFVNPLITEFIAGIKSFSQRKPPQNKIVIGSNHHAISYLMPKIILYFKTIHPDIKLIIQNIDLESALQRLRQDEVDLVFFPNFTQSEEIKLTEITSFDPILIMNKNHPLARKNLNSLADLKKYNLIITDQNLVILPMFENAVKTYNLCGSIEFENGNWEILKHFVKQNDFIAVVTSICLDKNDNDLAVKNLSQFFPRITYSVATKKGKALSSVTKDLIKIISEAYKN